MIGKTKKKNIIVFCKIGHILTSKFFLWLMVLISKILLSGTMRLNSIAYQSSVLYFQFPPTFHQLTMNREIQRP